MSNHPFDYGDECVNKVTAERLVAEAGLSEVDLEILYLRMAFDWPYEEIAKHIGKTYYGRTDENPLWERTIRYRLERSLKKLREVGNIGEDA